jgi:hypothetical protein
LELSRLEVVLAILVAQLELREAELLEELLVPLQGLLFLSVVGAVVARALVDGAVGELLPAIESAVAVRAPITSFRGLEPGNQLRQAATELAAQLRALAAIVEIEEIARRAAMRATAGGGQRTTAASFHRCQRPSVGALVIGTQRLPARLRLRRRNDRRLSKRCLGIDVKVAVMRMLLTKVVARVNLGLAPGQHFAQLLDESFEVGVGEFSAEPKDNPCYFVHGGESLGNLVSSTSNGLRRETSPPFSLPVKPHPARLARRPERSKPKTIWPKPGEKAEIAVLLIKFNELPA